MWRCKLSPARLEDVQLARERASLLARSQVKSDSAICDYRSTTEGPSAMTTTDVDLTEVGREEQLIRSLLDASVYPHEVDELQLIDTHISWVILTGRYAYKIKKPIQLEFLDFSTLELRKYFCEEELRLNRRWVQELYLDVVPICGSFTTPVVGSDGDAIEYAVKMVQFPYSARLDQQLDAGLVDEDDMLQLGETVAERHGALPVCEALDEEDARRLVRHPMLENLHHLRKYLGEEELGPLAAFTTASLERLWPQLLDRQGTGFVRECHGDLHLANLMRLESGITAFDCVEFNADLRNIDVISDVSFLVMDLVSRGREDLAFTFLNRYLERSGDYDGMEIFGLYYVYHALIRAKILAIRSIERSTEATRRSDLAEMHHFCDVARCWFTPRRPMLLLMHGFSGSGKTWLSQQLLGQLPAIRVRSDIERKRLYGLAEDESSKSAIGAGIYSATAKSDVYEALAVAARKLLQSGHNVIADAAFLSRNERQRFSELASDAGSDLIIVDARASEEELERRVDTRGRNAAGPSEADLDVLRYQRENADTLTEAELLRTIVIDTDKIFDPGRVIERLDAMRTH